MSIFYKWIQRINVGLAGYADDDWKFNLPNRQFNGEVIVGVYSH